MEDIITQEANCSFCEKEINPSNATFCNHCGHPENGSDEQRAKFFAKRAVDKTKNIDADKKIKSARNTLFILSGIVALFGFLTYNNSNEIIDLAVNLILSFIYLILGFWSEKKPLIALLSGLLLYITVIVISAIILPTSLISGLLWKIIILSYLGKGLYSASSIKK